MVSNAADLSRFSRALVSGRLLHPATLAVMTTTVEVGDEYFVGYGLGIGLKASPCGSVWGHDGGIIGYRSVVVVDRQGRWSAVLLWDPDASTSISGIDERQPAADGTFRRLLLDLGVPDVVTIYIYAIRG